MKHTKTLAALVLTAALALTGCGQTEAPAPAADAAVTVNGVAFTQADYEGAFLYSKSMLDMQLTMYGIDPAAFWGDSETYNEQIAQTAKQQLILQAVMENQMKEAGLQVDEAALDQQLAQQEEQLSSSDQSLDELLAMLHLTREQYRRMLSVDSMVPQLMEYYEAQDSQEIRKLYDEEFLRCKHVLVADEEGDPEKEALAKEIAEKAKNGADFDALVEEYGEDPGMGQSPDGYVFTKGDMVEPFYEGAKALEVNAVSDPVQSDFGWHIIQRLPLTDELYEAHQEQVAQSYFRQLMDGWMEGAEVTMTPEAEAVTFEALMPQEEAPVEEAETEGSAETETPAEEQ